MLLGSIYLREQAHADTQSSVFWGTQERLDGDCTRGNRIAQQEFGLSPDKWKQEQGKPLAPMLSLFICKSKASGGSECLLLKREWIVPVPPMGRAA